MNAIRAYVKKGYQIGIVTLEDIDEALQQEGDELRLQLPTSIRDYADVFSPKKADKLPPHRSYDHEIRLTSDKKLPFGKIYSMSCEELQTLRDWLDENLRKGFCSGAGLHSKSSSTSAMIQSMALICLVRKPHQK
jgi:hypothetical protein